jgi:hypothetical protein
MPTYFCLKIRPIAELVFHSAYINVGRVQSTARAAQYRQKMIMKCRVVRLNGGEAEVLSQWQRASVVFVLALRVWKGHQITNLIYFYSPKPHDQPEEED